MTKDLNETFEGLINHYTDCLLKTGRIVPALYVIAKDKMKVISGDDLPAETSLREKIFESIGEEMATELNDATGFIFVSEAFCDLRDKEDSLGGITGAEIMIIVGKRVGDGGDRMFIRQYKSEPSEMGKVTFCNNDKLQSANDVGWLTKPTEETNICNPIMHALWRSFKFNKLIKNLSQPNASR